MSRAKTRAERRGEQKVMVAMGGYLRVFGAANHVSLLRKIAQNLPTPLGSDACIVAIRLANPKQRTGIKGFSNWREQQLLTSEEVRMLEDTVIGQSTELAIMWKIGPDGRTEVGRKVWPPMLLDLEWRPADSFT